MKGFHVIIFSVLLITSYLLLGYYKIVDKRPQSIHQWAQCDRASVAKNYLDYGFDFFHPQVHNISNNTGITGMEFPLINFIAAITYNFLGFNEFFYRFISLLILSAGLIAAFKLAYLIVGHVILAGFAVLLFFLSPVLVFYTPNFLPEAPSLGLILIAWYKFYCWKKSGVNSELVFLFVVATLAVLIKITHLISLTAMIFFFIADTKKHEWVKQKKLLIALFISCFLILAWYQYAGFLNKKYGSSVFLLNATPVFTLREFKENILFFYNLWFSRIYSVSFFIYVIILSGFILINLRKTERSLIIIVVSLFSGGLLFFSLMSKQFRYHDYYIIPLLPFIFFLLLAAYRLIITEYSTSRSIMTVFYLITIGVFVHSFADSKDHFRTCYNKESWKYSNKVYDQYFDFETYLRSINVSRDDKVISLFDESPDITLYLMNQRGYSFDSSASNASIISCIKKGIKYLIVNNPEIYLRDSLKPYLVNVSGQYEQVRIYDVQQVNKPKNN